MYAEVQVCTNLGGLIMCFMTVSYLVAFHHNQSLKYSTVYELLRNS